MRVSACLVTRGDVPMDPILETLPKDWEVCIWDNGDPNTTDLKIFGRFMAAQYAAHDLIYFQDDDVLFREHATLLGEYTQYRYGQERDLLLVVDAHGGNYGGFEDLAFTGAGSIVSKVCITQTLDKWFSVWPFNPDDQGFLYEVDAVFGILAPSVQIGLPYTRLYEDHPTRPHLCREPWQADLKLLFANQARAIRDQQQTRPPIETLDNYPLLWPSEVKRRQTEKET